MNHLTIILLTIIGITLLGCANDPTHLIVAPEVMGPSHIKYQSQDAQLAVTDLRVAKHIIQITQKDKAAQLMTSQEDLSVIIKQTLAPQLSTQGLILTDVSDNYIEIIIDNALISVEQTVMSYSATNEISLRVKVKNNEQTLTKTFNSRGNNTGPLGVDIAVLERDFNQQLSNALTRILEDQEIQQFIH